jgi:CubicO group peptidase (beta-lactamase class C family)
MDIIQRVSGQSLESFAREHLFDPLGMSNTTFDTATLRQGDYTLPCTSDNMASETKYDELDATGDSGLYSTASDLAKFGKLFLSGGQTSGKAVFSEAAIQFMLGDATGGRFARSPIAMMRQVNNTHGCFGDLNSPQAMGHPGFSGCMLTIDPMYGIAAAIVTNSQNLHADWGNYRAINNFMLSVFSR